MAPDFHASLIPCPLVVPSHTDHEILSFTSLCRCYLPGNDLKLPHLSQTSYYTVRDIADLVSRVGSIILELCDLLISDIYFPNM